MKSAKPQQSSSLIERAASVRSMPRFVFWLHRQPLESQARGGNFDSPRARVVWGAVKGLKQGAVEQHDLAVVPRIRRRLLGLCNNTVCHGLPIKG